MESLNFYVIVIGALEAVFKLKIIIHFFNNLQFLQIHFQVRWIIYIFVNINFNVRNHFFMQFEQLFR